MYLTVTLDPLATCFLHSYRCVVLFSLEVFVIVRIKLTFRAAQILISSLIVAVYFGIDTLYMLRGL